jgi:hypothetical protein
MGNSWYQKDPTRCYFSVITVSSRSFTQPPRFSIL